MPNRVKDVYALFAALTLLLVLFFSPSAEAETGEETGSWRFRVFHSHYSILR